VASGRRSESGGHQSSTQADVRHRDSSRVTRDIGYAILAAEGFETTDEVVFGEPSDLILLGVRTLEGFSVTVDNVGHELEQLGPHGGGC